nr:hypothetical protein L204_01063 [Cryptococcus depauperatus CBS 7855]
MISPPLTASTSASLILLPSSPSSSHSSLTIENLSFDPSTAPRDNTPPPTLGLRELLKMRERDSQRKTKSRQLQSNADAIRNRDIILQVNSHGAGEGGIFASQVDIKGWKVVGGNDWQDVGKLGAYVVYDIEITLSNGGSINILRRYTDFVHLRTALKRRYLSLGKAIPPLPGKNHMGELKLPPTSRSADIVPASPAKFSPKFLEDRQPRLQRFLRGVMLHPEMGRGGSESIVGAWVIGDVH